MSPIAFSTPRPEPLFRKMSMMTRSDEWLRSRSHATADFSSSAVPTTSTGAFSCSASIRFSRMIELSSTMYILAWSMAPPSSHA